MLPNNSRLKIILQGVVQGIGLRPKLYQLALNYGLTGFCYNFTQGVVLEYQGQKHSITQALTDIESFLNQFATVQKTVKSIPCLNDTFDFKILPSQGLALADHVIAPDMAVCANCLQECFNPNNRRFQYPLNSCAICGPRFSICHRVPFDRQNTSMAQFELCTRCQVEYQDPTNRRFHAQTISCWECGPKIWMTDKYQQVIASNTAVINKLVQVLNQDKIVAVKGVGGFHLIVRSDSEKAIKNLRKIKNRPHKPFALMYHTLEELQGVVDLSDCEAKCLQGFKAPILITNRKHNSIYKISNLIAPDQTTLGVLLAYTPLYHLILSKIGVSLVVTSANVTNEPIIYQNQIMQENTQLADFFVYNNRDIVHPVEDSVLQNMANKNRMIRLGRGYLPFHRPIKTQSTPFISLGGHLKNHLAYTNQNSVSLSSYFGDLDSVESINRYSIALNSILSKQPNAKIIRDFHPDYACNQETQSLTNDTMHAQHHLSHIFSVIEEHKLSLPLLAFAWDGLGMGKHKELLGGECFVVSPKKIEHIVTLDTLLLSGGDKAMTEPRRVALGMLFKMGELVAENKNLFKQFEDQELKILRHMLEKNIQTPKCSSMGRLFDGVSALLGGPAKISYEAQGALYLENLAKGYDAKKNKFQFYPTKFKTLQDKSIIDWNSMIQNIILDVKQGLVPSCIAYKFHAWCAKIIENIALQQDLRHVVLSGGVFQNKLLTELSIELLNLHGFTVWLNEDVPLNDGGLAFGQIALAHYIQQNKSQEGLCA